MNDKTDEELKAMKAAIEKLLAERKGALVARSVGNIREVLGNVEHDVLKFIHIAANHGYAVELKKNG